MKILLLTDGIFPFRIGGMQKHSFYLASFLAKRGHDITLVHCVDHGKSLPSNEEVFKALGAGPETKLEVISLHFPAPGNMPGHYLKESYAYSSKIYGLLKERLQEFDFIYAKGFSAWHMLAQRSKGQKMPPVGVKFHGYEMFQKPAGIKEWLKSLMLRGPVKWNNLRADRVFSYGGKITELIKDLGVPAPKLIEIPTGIDESWFRSSAAKQGDIVQFVFVGRFERRKGVEELTAALQKLEPGNNFHFHFVGPIPPSKKIQSKKITYHGQLESVEALMKVLDKCDVLVVPSHSEGMPNVIMEGMARALAVVATDVGAVSAVVSEENGWIIEPGSADEIEKVIMTILAMPASGLEAKKQASLRKIRGFSWHEIAAKTEAAISAAL